MSKPRLYIQPEHVSDDTIILSDEQQHYLKNVLRVKQGDTLTFFDGNGKKYMVRYDRSSHCRIISSLPEERLPQAVEITLVQGIAKGEKMDQLIRKCTEIGVNRFIPCLCARTVVKLDQESSLKKVERWQKIAQAAAQQSDSIIVPVVDTVLEFPAALRQINKEALKIIPYEEEKSRTIRSVLSASPATKIAIFIGPEGGFSPAEIEQAKEAGAIPVSLGKQILRTETAGLITAAIIKYEKEW